MGVRPPWRVLFYAEWGGLPWVSPCCCRLWIDLICPGVLWRRRLCAALSFRWLGGEVPLVVAFACIFGRPPFLDLKVCVLPPHLLHAGCRLPHLLRAAGGHIPAPGLPKTLARRGRVPTQPPNLLHSGPRGGCLSTISSADDDTTLGVNGAGSLISSLSSPLDSPASRTQTPLELFHSHCPEASSRSESPSPSATISFAAWILQNTLFHDHKGCERFPAVCQAQGGYIRASIIVCLQDDTMRYFGFGVIGSGFAGLMSALEISKNDSIANCETSRPISIARLYAIHFNGEFYCQTICDKVSGEPKGKIVKQIHIP